MNMSEINLELRYPDILLSDDDVRAKLRATDITPDLVQRYKDPAVLASTWASTNDSAARQLALIVVVLNDFGDSLEALLQDGDFNFPELTGLFIAAVFFGSRSVVQAFYDFYERNEQNWMGISEREQKKRIKLTECKLFSLVLQSLIQCSGYFCFQNPENSFKRP